MDLQSRKLHLISFLAQLQDETLIAKIENFISKKKTPENIENLPFGGENLLDRIRQSEEDFQNNRVKTQEELERISSNW